MDIISAHQHGLIEQLDDEVAALAGLARDFGQRAVVLHHLYDHARGAHEWALAEAKRNLRIFEGIELLRLRLRRWGWLHSRRVECEQALDLLADALGNSSRRRCAGAYRLYRLTATPALRGEAERLVPPQLLAALDLCHAARRAGEALPEADVRFLADESERCAAAADDQRQLSRAWAAIETTGLRRPALRLLGAKALNRASSRDRKSGWSKIERQLRSDPVLPASFRANPAQHFYALQRLLAERRRQHWREACDREPDAVELAA
jgi:hypothetical protein